MFNKYYQDELSYLRELGREFAGAYPALAPMLAERGADPDVERLLEGVAFLTARVREKLEDELPEAIVGMASLLFPELTRPRPGATILEMVPHANVLRERLVVPAGTEFASVKVDGTSCRFRSTVETTVTPWLVDDVALETLAGGKQHLRVDLRLTAQAPLGQLVGDTLRLHFAGESAQSLDLLLWAREHTEEIQLWDPKAKGGSARVLRLPKTALTWRAIEPEESLLPEDETVLPSYRLLQDYYHLPAKFAFVDIDGASALAELREVSRVSLSMVFDAPHPRIQRLPREAVKVNCVPVVNVFATTAEPIRIAAHRGAYLVRPAELPPAHGEVYRIESVEAVGRGGERVPVHDFFRFEHAAQRASSRAFYTTHLRPSMAEGADMSMAFGVADADGGLFDAEVVSIDLLATNRQLASALRVGEVGKATAWSPSTVTFRNILPVTRSVPAPVGRDLHWRAVAHAVMGLRSIADPTVLRAVLDVYNTEAAVDRQAARANQLRAAALREVRVTPAERVSRGSVVRGVEVEVELDENGFSGPGDLYLFSAVLDRLFADYLAINTFGRTSVVALPSRTRYPWPPRSGTSPLL